MAYPQVASTSTDGRGSGSFDATLPSGITSGDLILIFGFREGSNTDITDPSGYTRLNTESGNSRRSWLWAREATGSDTFTYPSAGDIALCMYRITGWYGGTLTSAIASEAITDFSGDWNAASLTPSWGSAENLWIVGIGRPAQAAIGANPTGYSSNAIESRSDGVYGTARLVSKEATAASDDPAAMASGSSTNHMWTIAVRPASSSGPAKAVLFSNYYRQLRS